MKLTNLGALFSLFGGSLAVDRTKFRTCKDTGFCRRHRSSNVAEPQFRVLKESVASHGLDGITALLQGDQIETPPLKMTLKFYDSGVARIQVSTIWLTFVTDIRVDIKLTRPYPAHADPRGKPFVASLGSARYCA